MKGKYITAISLFLIFCFVLSGCSDTSFSDNALLHPPRATGDAAEIQNIITNQAGSSYTLKYPESGEYRSAVTIHKTDEKNSFAVALYSTDSDSRLNLSVIVSENEKWKCLGSFTNPATGVDRIMFEDINGDGTDEIIVGWTSFNNAAKNITSYSIENGAVREMMIDETYSEIIVTDITSDEKVDIVLISPSTSKSAANITLLQYSEQEKRPIGKFALDLDPEIISFSNITAGKINKDTNGIVIDGEKSGGILSTQIIYYDQKENTLKEPLLQYGENGKFTNSTNRKDVITSRDIDNDGIIEFPVVTQMSAPANFNGGNICNMTSWKQYSVKSETPETKVNMIINYTDGYYFTIPEKWNGTVTAVTNPESRTMTFYTWDSKESLMGNKLLSVYRFTNSEWNQQEKTNLIQLNVELVSSKAVIAAEIYDIKDKSLIISKEEVITAVKTISSAA